MSWYVDPEERRRKILSKILAVAVSCCVFLSFSIIPVVCYRIVNGAEAISKVPVSGEIFVFGIGVSIGAGLSYIVGYTILRKIGGFNQRDTLSILPKNRNHDDKWFH